MTMDTRSYGPVPVADQVTVPMGATVTAHLHAGDSITIQVPSGADDPDSFDGSVSCDPHSRAQMSPMTAFLSASKFRCLPDWPHDTEVSLAGH